MSRKLLKAVGQKFCEMKEYEEKIEMKWRRRESLILNLQTNDDDEAKETTKKYSLATRHSLSDSDHSLISFLCVDVSTRRASLNHRPFLKHLTFIRSLTNTEKNEFRTISFHGNLIHIKCYL